MSLELLATIVGAAISLLAGSLISTETIQKLVRGLLKMEAPQKSYSERLSEHTEKLIKASHELDAVLAELTRVAKERAQAVERLEYDLTTMEGREKELKERIDTLEKTPLIIAEHFAGLLEPGQKRSAKRDFLLFGVGVAVSTVISVAIQVLL